jgi:hypothetical protein
MPSLEPGKPGAKEAYGISIVGRDGSIRIPPMAFARYELNAGDLAVVVTTHRGEGGFALLNKTRAEATVFGKYIRQLEKPDVACWFQGKAYALTRVDLGTIRLAPELLEAYQLKTGNQLMVVKSTTVAMSFTPAAIWKEKLSIRGLTEAVANIDKLELFYC